MTLEIFAMCRSATVAADGTTSFEGVFDRIAASSFPVVTQMNVMVRIRVGSLESREGVIRLMLVGPDGESAYPPVVNRYNAEPFGDSISKVINGVFNLTNIVLRAAGPHSLVLLVNDRIEASLPLEVVLNESLVKPGS